MIGWLPEHAKAASRPAHPVSNGLVWSGFTGIIDVNTQAVVIYQSDLDLMLSR